MHGSRYDYSKVEYKSLEKKVIIICKEHGEFLQKPSAHIKNKRSGCIECLNEERKTKSKILKQNKLKKELKTQSKIAKQKLKKEHIVKYKSLRLGKPLKPQSKVIEKFRKVHGNTYDYSKVKYEGAIKKVVIICKEHGEFLQLVVNHNIGSGCPKCGQIRRNNFYWKKNPISTDKIIGQFKKVHGNRYDYSKVEYVNNKTKVIIICKEHGEFLQNLNNHRLGMGCSKCAYDNMKKPPPPKTDK